MKKEPTGNIFRRDASTYVVTGTITQAFFLNRGFRPESILPGHLQTDGRVGFAFKATEELESAVSSFYSNPRIHLHDLDFAHSQVLGLISNKFPRGGRLREFLRRNGGVGAQGAPPTQ